MFIKKLNNLEILHKPLFFPAAEASKNHKLLLTASDGKNLLNLVFFGDIASRAALTLKQGDEINIKAKTNKMGSRKFFHVKNASVNI